MPVRSRPRPTQFQSTSLSLTLAQDEVGLRSGILEARDGSFLVCIPEAQQQYAATLLNTQFPLSETRQLRIKVSFPTGLDPSRHAVLAVHDQWCSPLARLFARVFGRPFFELPRAQTANTLALPRNTESLTVFLPIDWPVGLPWLDSLMVLNRENVNVSPPALGIMAAGSLADLSWFALKQLLKDGLQRQRNALASDPCDLQDLLEQNVFQPASSDSVVIDAHSRPHCGRLSVADREVGICGATTRGEKGLCFEGRRCVFRHNPKIPLEDIPANRILFNGCFTACVAGTPHSIPVASLLSSSAIRGRAYEYIGNAKLGWYGKEDIQWFVALSSANIPAPRVVHLINELRENEKREVGMSMIFFGDAAAGPWPTMPSQPAHSRILKRQVTISSTVLGPRGFRISGKRWGRLGSAGVLHASVRPQNVARRFSIRALALPWSNESVVMLIPRTPQRHGTRVTLTLKDRIREAPPNGRHTLELALRRTSYLRTLPLFAQVMADFESSIHQLLVSLRQAESDRTDLSLHSGLLASHQKLECDLVQQLDKLLTTQTCEAAANTSWNWEDEYNHEARLSIKGRQARCPLCGGRTQMFCRQGVIPPRFSRRQIVCCNCGILSDLPSGFAGYLEKRPKQAKSNHLVDQVWISNATAKPRDVTLSLVANGFGLEQGRVETKRIHVLPKEHRRISLRLSTAKPLSGFARVRVYFASGGDLGFFGRPHVF